MGKVLRKFLNGYPGAVSRSGLCLFAIQNTDR